MLGVGAPAPSAKLQGHIMQITFSERELEDFLCEGKNLQKYLGLIFVARQVKVDRVGIVDILAFDWDSKSWVIIELKKAKLDCYALAQGLSYLNYYKTVSSYKDYIDASKKRRFKLLLIGDSLDDNLQKSVQHFDGNFSDNWDIYYSLFGLDFSSGISFEFIHQDNESLIDHLRGTCDALNAYSKNTRPINYFPEK